MFKKSVFTSVFLFLPIFAHAANIIINPITGFTDVTVTSPIGGNPGTTLGAQRLNTFQKAADILETYLDVKVDIKVDAAFSGLSCGPSSAILGSAGATGGYINFTNAPAANTIYPVALANNLAITDINSTTAEITATFNSNIDNNNNCLTGVDWYYGYDDPALAGAEYVNDTSFLSVVIHELLHGLGVSSWVLQNGALNSGLMDTYSANLYDQTSAKAWSAMNDSERLASMTNTNNLVWTGTSVNTSAAALALTDGINSGKVEMYAPSPYEGGSSVSHFSKDATPNEIMEPSYTEFLTTPGMATELLQDIGWALAAGNTAPVLTNIGGQSSDEDNAKVISLSATDNEGDSLSYLASSDNGSVTTSVIGNQLTLTPADNYFGNANITVTVSDGALSDSETFLYTVNSINDLPSFTSAASGSVQYGNSLTVNLSATDIETAANNISFSVQSSNASQVSASLSGSTLTLTPVNNYIGNSTLTLRATDGDGGTKDQSYSLTITAIPNTAPVLTNIGGQSSDEDNAKVISLAATDNEGDSLSYSASSDNGSVTTSVIGNQLTLTPADNYFGSANITVTVSDGALTDSETFLYSVNSVNDLPSFTSAATGSVQYGNNLTVNLSATDIETAANAINFSVQSSNASQVSASLSGSTLTLTPVNNYIGNSTLTLRATDGDGGTKDQSYSLTITAIPNTAPVLTNIGGQSSDEDNAKVISLAATDNEGDSLSYLASSDNGSVTTSVIGNQLTLTPTDNYFGNANITVTVSDGALSDSETFLYTVNSVNDLPSFTSTATGSVQYGNSLTVNLSAADIETAANNINFSVQSSNASQVSASIIGSSLTLTPVNDYIGNTNLTLRATDSNSGSADQVFTLSITNMPNTAPVLAPIGSQDGSEDSIKVINLSASDSEGDNLSFSASSDNDAITASINGNQLTLSGDQDYFGQANISVTVSDGVLSDSESFLYTVSSVNDLASFTNAAQFSTLYSAMVEVELTVTDIDDNNHSFALLSHNADQITAVLNNSVLVIQANNNFHGTSFIQVSAHDGEDTVQQTIEVEIFEDFQLTSNTDSLKDGEESQIQLDSFNFTLSGGDNSHNIEVIYDGQDLSDQLLTQNNGQYSLAMPSQGAFAGQYEVRITDSRGDSASFILERPLRLLSNTTQLVYLSESQELYIEGAPAGSLIDLNIEQDNNQVSLQQNNQEVSQVIASDDAARFNRAIVKLNLLENNEASNIMLHAEGITLPKASLSLETIQMKSVDINVTDTSGNPVASMIEVNDARFITWGLNQNFTTSNLGQASIELPSDQGSNLLISAENYLSQNIELAKTELALAVELIAIENPLTISGKVSTSSLNFIEQAPVVQLIATDGSMVQAGLSNISSDSVEYAVTVNKHLFSAHQLSVQHGEIHQDIPLLSTEVDSTINIHIDQVQLINAGNEIEEPEEVVELNTPAAGHLPVAFLIISLICLTRIGRRD